MKLRNVTPRLLTAVSGLALVLSLVAFLAVFLPVPTTWPPPAPTVVFCVGNALLVGLLTRLSLRLAGFPAPWPLVTTAAAAGLWLEPVSRTLVSGGTGLVLVCLVLWDLRRDERVIGRGLALGAAAGVAFTPAVFILYLLITGRVRAGLTALASLSGTALLVVLVLGRVPDAPQPGALWALGAGTTAAGLWIARRATSPAWAVLAVAATAMLVPAPGRAGTWLWCVPLLAVLFAEGHRRAAAALATFLLARTLWLAAHQGGPGLAHLSWWQQPIASPYPLLGLAVLALAARRGQPPGSPVVVPGPRAAEPAAPSGPTGAKSGGSPAQAAVR